MEEQQEINKPLSHWQRERNRFIYNIQGNAINSKLSNGVKKELTYQQALSIMLRSKQLIREGSYRPNVIGPRTKTAQINECYRQRMMDNVGN